MTVAEAIATSLRSCALTIREQNLAPIQAAEYLNQRAATVLEQAGLPMEAPDAEPAAPPNPSGTEHPQKEG